MQSRKNMQKIHNFVGLCLFFFFFVEIIYFFLSLALCRRMCSQLPAVVYDISQFIHSVSLLTTIKNRESKNKKIYKIDKHFRRKDNPFWIIYFWKWFISLLRHLILCNCLFSLSILAFQFVFLNHILLFSLHLFSDPAEMIRQHEKKFTCSPHENNI